MGCSPLADFRFQMGVTVMGFAEHFGKDDVKIDKANLSFVCLVLQMENYKLLINCKLNQALTCQFIPSHPRSQGFYSSTQL